MRIEDRTPPDLDGKVFSITISNAELAMLRNEEMNSIASSGEPGRAVSDRLHGLFKAASFLEKLWSS